LYVYKLTAFLELESEKSGGHQSRQLLLQCWKDINTWIDKCEMLLGCS